MAKMLELRDETLIINSCDDCPMYTYEYWYKSRVWEEACVWECVLSQSIIIRTLSEIHPECKLKEAK